MQLKWDDLRLFLAVCDEGSLSAAARTMGLGQATLSRRIAEMEAQVGEPLFVRQSQGVVLTDMGRQLLPSVQRMAEWATQATHSLTPQSVGIAGRVRIAAPPGVAQDFLAPFAARLLQAHPQLRLEVLSSLDVLDLSRGEADLSLRMASPTDPEHICLDRIQGPIRVFVAMPYAATLPTPCQLTDLRWISWAGPFEYLRTHQELIKAIPGFAPAFASDDYNVQTAACEAGAGALLEARIKHRYARINRLVELDIDLGPDAMGTLYLVCHRRQHQLPKVQVVVNAIREEFVWARQANGSSDQIAALPSSTFKAVAPFSVPGADR